MTMPIISAGLAGILLIVQQILMLSAGSRRLKSRIGVGHEGDPTLERLVRRHGNLAENAAIFVVALALLEMLGDNGTAVLWLAAIFLATRLAHVVSFSNLAGSHGGKHAKDGGRVFTLLRPLGAVGTALVAIVTGAYLVYSVWGIMAM